MLQKIKQILTYPVFKFKINYASFNPKNYNWLAIKSFLKIFILAITAVFIILLLIDLIVRDFVPNDNEEKTAEEISDFVIEYLEENYIFPLPDEKNKGCNVAGIQLHGSLKTYLSPFDFDDKGNLIEDVSSSNNINSEIADAEKNNDTKAIILEIDSWGGMPVAADEINAALLLAKKPTVAWIRAQGLSAAYMAASAADIIFASMASDVGSIGTTLSYLDYSKKNKKDGLTFNSISSGKFKDMGNPDKPLTEEERTLMMRDLKIVNDYFVKIVATNRKLTIAEVSKLADGSSMTGIAALQSGLVDKIGGFHEIKDYLKEKIGEDVRVCW